uniref:Uncharacterized protein n=1 Tax=viral metagenome TaxID=1070528 RepID=A0A6H1ZNM7_9ZZZZ
MEEYLAKLGERVAVLELVLKHVQETHNKLAKEVLKLRGSK